MNARESFEDVKKSIARRLSKETGKSFEFCYDMLKNDTALDTVDFAIEELETLKYHHKMLTEKAVSLTNELAEIKARAEERCIEYKYAYTEGLSNDSVASIIDFIIKGEPK